MRVDELLELAHDVARNGSEIDSPAEKLAFAVQELLGVDALPCGWENVGITSVRPTRENPRGEPCIVIPRQWAGTVTVDEARALFVIATARSSSSAIARPTLPPKARYVNIHPHVLHLFALLEETATVLPDFTRGTGGL